jgi:hypothetical protein
MTALILVLALGVAVLWGNGTLVRPGPDTTRPAAETAAVPTQAAVLDLGGPGGPGAPDGAAAGEQQGAAPDLAGAGDAAAPGDGPAGPDGAGQGSEQDSGQDSEQDSEQDSGQDSARDLGQGSGQDGAQRTRRPGSDQDDAPSAARPVIPASFGGGWAGQVSQPLGSGRTFPMTVRLTAGGTTGTMVLPSLECTARLRLTGIGDGGSQVSFSSRTVVDPGGRCAEAAVVTLASTGTGDLSFFWQDVSNRGNTAGATLVRT